MSINALRAYICRRMHTYNVISYISSYAPHLQRGTCITTAMQHSDKPISQWQCSFQMKAAPPLAKRLVKALWCSSNSEGRHLLWYTQKLYIRVAFCYVSWEFDNRLFYSGLLHRHWGNQNCCSGASRRTLRIMGKLSHDSSTMYELMTNKAHQNCVHSIGNIVYVQLM